MGKGDAANPAPSSLDCRLSIASSQLDPAGDRQAPAVVQICSFTLLPLPKKKKQSVPDRASLDEVCRTAEKKESRVLPSPHPLQVRTGGGGAGETGLVLISSLRTHRSRRQVAVREREKPVETDVVWTCFAFEKKRTDSYSEIFSVKTFLFFFRRDWFFWYAGCLKCSKFLTTYY